MTYVDLLSITPNYMKLLTTAAGQCYQKSVNEKTIQHIIAAGHLSVLEHCSASFFVCCSISTLLQLTRHRHLSFTVQSSRYSKLCTYHRTSKSEVDEAINNVIYSYTDLLSKGYSFEDAAYVLPKAAEYSLVVTGNFRTWFEYLPKRLCFRVQKEHRILAEEIGRLLSSAAPEVFKRDMTGCSICPNKCGGK